MEFLHIGYESKLFISLFLFVLIIIQLKIFFAIKKIIKDNNNVLDELKSKEKSIVETLEYQKIIKILKFLNNYKFLIPVLIIIEIGIIIYICFFYKG